jgi:hypothetical protein
VTPRQLIDAIWVHRSFPITPIIALEKMPYCWGRTCTPRPYHCTHQVYPSFVISFTPTPPNPLLHRLETPMCDNQCFFGGQILCYRQSDSDTHEDLARFGYKIWRIFFKTSFYIFWLPTWITYRNLVIFLKF